MNTGKLIPPTFLLAGLLGLTAGACKQGVTPQSDARVDTVCKRYCSRANECNDLTNYDECVSDCVDKAGKCDSDKDAEAALDKLDQCPDNECGTVLGCGTKAWVECTF